MKGVLMASHSQIDGSAGREAAPGHETGESRASQGTPPATGARTVGLRAHFLTLLAIWTALVSAVLVWTLQREKDEMREMARITARTAVAKDVLYRRWAAEHKGVYVPATERTPPNPHLTDLARRDVELVSGGTLTLINPAYMTRQVRQLAGPEAGLCGRVTSLRPIRPENRADGWEAQSLAAFRQGQDEVSSVQNIEGEPHMRLMVPLRTEPGCLSCHEEQRYEVGDIRGGISVAVPLGPMQAVDRRHASTLIVGHGAMWLLGAGGIFIGIVRLGRRIRERDLAQDELHSLNADLEQRVTDRTERLTTANQQLTEEIETRRHLQHQLMDVTEQEHRKLGEELHDTISQELTGIAYLSRVLEQKLETKALPESLDAKRMTELLRETLDRTRRLAKTLHPVGPGADGLCAALGALAETTEELFEINCTVNCDDSVVIKDDAVAEHLHRIAQEAVTNAVRHGRADKIEIELAIDAEGQRLTVRSDGMDFPQSPSQSEGIGLQIMKYRAEVIGGRLDVRRGDTGGTEVTFMFPVENNFDDAEDHSERE